VRIIDKGDGIAADQLSLVFDRYWRTQGDRSDGASGLGFAIASSIYGTRGVRIQVSSEQGCGSCFELIPPFLRAS
jgi:signal transduction histidine kinase